MVRYADRIIGVLLTKQELMSLNPWKRMEFTATAISSKVGGKRNYIYHPLKDLREAGIIGRLETHRAYGGHFIYYKED